MRWFTIVLCMCLATVTVMAADTEITGSVVSANGKPISGVTVRVLKTKLGTFTKSKGEFKIALPSGMDYTLAFSMVGYTTKEIAVASAELSKPIRVMLEQDVLKLEEVVVVGYGTKQRKDLTGSIARVDAKEIAQNTYGNFENAIVGRAPGVQVINSNGMAGSAMTIRVRGVGSLTASGEPLYVIDGVPVTQGDFGGKDRLATQTNALASINPNDIESIDILKDADAAAIYGSRGSNGVVLITTKRGSTGNTKFNVSLFNGTSNETNRIAMLNGDEFRSMWAEANYNDSVALKALRPNAKFTPKPLPGAMDPALYSNTDWLDRTMQTGRITDANITASGGSTFATFFTSLGYRDESSYAVGNTFQRLNGRANIEVNATEDVKIGLSANLNYADNKRVPSAWAGGIGAAQSSALPYFPVYNPDGSYFEPKRPWYAMYNPVAQLNENRFNNIEQRVLANLYTAIKLPLNFSLRIQGGLDQMNFTDRRYTSLIVQSEAEAELRKVGVKNWVLNVTLD